LIEGELEASVMEFHPQQVGDKYEVLNELGRGSFSVVYSALSIESGEQVAVKAIAKTHITKQGWINLSREVEIMLGLKHENVLRLRHIIDTESHVYLILDYLDGGELFDQVVKRGSFVEADASKIIRQILCGICYLHSQGVAHRDLKPENLLCSIKDERVVVADFGLAKVFGRGKLLKTHCGTPKYAAPEIIRGDDVYDKMVDMWSIGVITYVLLAGSFPFYHADPEILKRQIINAQFSFPDPQWSHISNSAKDFIEKLLVVDPSRRLSAELALDHPWMKENLSGPRMNNVDLLGGMESFQSNQRKLRNSGSGNSDLIVVDN